MTAAWNFQNKYCSTRAEQQLWNSFLYISYCDFLHIPCGTTPRGGFSLEIRTWSILFYYHRLFHQHGKFEMLTDSFFSCTGDSTWQNLKAEVQSNQQREREVVALGEAMPLHACRHGVPGMAPGLTGACLTGFMPLWEFRGFAKSAALWEVPTQGCEMLGSPQVRGTYWEIPKATERKANTSSWIGPEFPSVDHRTLGKALWP